MLFIIAKILDEQNYCSKILDRRQHQRADKRPVEDVLIDMTTVEKTERLTPLEKFAVLAGDIDQVRLRIESIQAQQSVDDLLETLDISELGEKFGVSMETMKKRLIQAGGTVFKMGKKYVIRKVRFLEVLETLESQ